MPTAPREAMRSINQQEAACLAEFTELGLGKGNARTLWRSLMAAKTQTHTYVSELRAKGRDEGRGEGRAEAILLVLEGRGVVVSDVQRERIRSCTDTEQLERWLRRAGIAVSAEELLA